MHWIHISSFIVNLKSLCITYFLASCSILYPGLGSLDNWNWKKSYVLYSVFILFNMNIIELNTWTYVYIELRVTVRHAFLLLKLWQIYQDNFPLQYLSSLQIFDIFSGNRLSPDKNKVNKWPFSMLHV